MALTRNGLAIGLIATLALTSACSRGGNRGTVDTPPADEILSENLYGESARTRSTIWAIFRARDDVGQIGAVNKYLWNASLEVLNFLPVQSVDPFTGVITTGFGTPPGGGRAYRATVYVSDPALDARSLNVALMTQSGPASASTVRAVEDAILTRARQLRGQDSRL